MYNIHPDRRVNSNNPDNSSRNDNYLSYGLIEGHVVHQPGKYGWGAFAGYWEGEMDDGEHALFPDSDIDKVEKHYLGLEALMKLEGADLFAPIGYTDTVGSDFSNTTSEGTDFRQIRDRVFAAIGGDFYATDRLVLNGRLARVFRESSDSGNAIVPVDFTGLNAEFGAEYQPSTLPLTLTGGVGYSYGRFSGSNSDDEVANTVYAYVGLTYWIGGGGLAENRRKLLPVRALDYLVSAETMAVGPLN
ncbi:hypothetical protein HW561_03390 [Rhodobacteraceae bacterium B1Z28]|uniref:Uncharacterized protein n=1 Tax=Ruegeria haliotis TaxID=2747601 RepID=A0ABX2PM22_9RHOB|nr:hypothetical protein [Ruegeria haliotis]NVO54830.1 hypothetical protein [Ruegeria haliotis]